MHLFSSQYEAARPPAHRGASTLAILLALPLVLFTALLVIQWLLLWTQRSNLQQAASAGAVEATLPRASWQSVGQVVRREVSTLSIASQIDPPMIEVNGQPAGAVLAPRSGDEIAVSVSVDATTVVPDWLGPIGFSLEHRKLRSRVVMQIP